MFAGHSLDTLWSEWSLYEMIKQSVLVCFARKFPDNSFSSQHSAYWLPYLHDKCHCIFLHAFIFLALEMTLFLPCEESLWKASMNGISPFPLEHLTGVSMPQQHVKEEWMKLNPFSHLILIHAILKNLFTVCLDSRLSNLPKTSPPVHRQTQTTSPEGSQMNVIAEVVA